MHISSVQRYSTGLRVYAAEFLLLSLCLQIHMSCKSQPASLCSHLASSSVDAFYPAEVPCMQQVHKGHATASQSAPARL